MDADRLPVMQEMVVASTKEERIVQLDKLQVMQESDFYGIFEAMEGLPVTIRLLDPPLHEFLPKIPELTKASRPSTRTAPRPRRYRRPSPAPANSTSRTRCSASADAASA